MFSYTAHIHRHKHQCQWIEQKQQPVVAHRGMLREECHKQQQTSRQTLQSHEQYIKTPESSLFAHLARHDNECSHQQQQCHIEWSEIAMPGNNTICFRNNNIFFVAQRTLLSIGIHDITIIQILVIICRDELQFACRGRIVNIRTKKKIYCRKSKFSYRLGYIGESKWQKNMIIQ